MIDFLRQHIDTVNNITLAVLLSYLPVYLVWEIVALALRGAKITVKTISMVARDKSWYLSSWVYFYGGMAGHWLVPMPKEASAPGGVSFWVIMLALLVQDVALRKTPRAQWSLPLRWQRFPALLFVVGFLAGIFLFPQRGLLPWQ